MRIAAMLSILIVVATCGSDDPQQDHYEPVVNVVDHVDPVSRALTRDANVLVSDLAAMSEEQRENYLSRVAPRLERSVVVFLKDVGKLAEDAEVERVEFHYGSLDRVHAEDGLGQVHEGYFRDELVASVYIKGQEKPYDAIVRCLNGLIELPRGELAKLQKLGERRYSSHFVIGRGQGLLHHVDYALAMDLAERFNLPLYLTKDVSPENRITVDEAREVETGRTQVTVLVFEGDEFDLDAMTYSPARQ